MTAAPIVSSQFPTWMLKFPLHQSQSSIFIPSLLLFCSCRSTFSCMLSLYLTCSCLPNNEDSWPLWICFSCITIQSANCSLQDFIHRMLQRWLSSVAPSLPQASHHCLSPLHVASHPYLLVTSHFRCIVAFLPVLPFLFLLPLFLLYAPMSFMITFRQIIVLSGRLLSKGSLQMCRGWIELLTRYSNSSLKLVCPKLR